MNPFSHPIRKAISKEIERRIASAIITHDNLVKASEKTRDQDIKDAEQRHDSRVGDILKNAVDSVLTR